MGSKPSTLSVVTLTTSWDADRTRDKTLDLDISALSLTAARVVPTDADFVFFNNATSPSGAVTHAEGSSAGVETIRIDLSAVPSHITEIAVLATVYDDVGAFGRLVAARIQVADAGFGELAEFDLTTGSGHHSVLHYGSVYRDGDRWLFRAEGTPYPDLASAIGKFGVRV